MESTPQEALPKHVLYRRLHTDGRVNRAPAAHHPRHTALQDEEVQSAVGGRGMPGTPSEAFPVLRGDSPFADLGGVWAIIQAVAALSQLTRG